MVTVEHIDGGKFSLIGKSTDTKPTEKELGAPIENGSTFFEMDTQKVKYYDADINDWI